MWEDAKIKEYHKEYYQRNKAKMDERNYAFKERNAESLKEYRQAYYKAKYTYTFIGNSKIFQINAYTGEIINIQNQKLVPIKYDNTFMILENKKIYRYKVILKNRKYKVVLMEEVSFIYKKKRRKS